MKSNSEALEYCRREGEPRDIIKAKEGERQAEGGERQARLSILMYNRTRKEAGLWPCASSEQRARVC
jgi:hypothetical protein